MSIYIEDCYNEGNAALGRRNYEEALKSYDKVVESHSKSANFWRNRGLALSGLRRYEDAISSFEKAIEIDLSFSDAWRNKGLAFYSLGRYDEAIENLDKAIKLDPNFASALNEKGHILSRLGQYEKALECYDKAIMADPNNIASLLNKGIALSNLKLYEEALKQGEKAISINSLKPGLWHFKASILYQLDRFDEAIECANKEIDQNKTNSKPWVVKGRSLMRLGKISEAMGCINKALYLDKNSIDALSGLSLLYLDYTFEFNKALDVNKRILELMTSRYPGEQLKSDYYMASIDSVKLDIAECLIKTNQYKEGRSLALKVLNGLTEYTPQRASKRMLHELIARYLISISYFLEGDVAEGESALIQFFGYYNKLIEKYSIGEHDWTFRGLVYFITSSSLNEPEKFLFLSLIGLLQGRLDMKDFSFYKYLAALPASEYVP